jgi:hypothetical protein
MIEFELLERVLDFVPVDVSRMELRERVKIDLMFERNI